MQARVVQKYIEKPLLYKGKKFDLRQWVLVKSFNPLRVYFFSHCYMRMCSQTYDLNDCKNLFKHLTNYSLNKHNFDNDSESVYSSDLLETFLQSKNLSWNEKIK